MSFAIENNGALYANRAFTKIEKKCLETFFDDCHWRTSYGDVTITTDENGNSIVEFVCVDERDLEAILPEMFELVPDALFNGEIEESGDFDGYIYVANNEIEELHISECWRKDASDAALIKVLEARGYKVRKTNKETSFRVIQK